LWAIGFLLLHYQGVAQDATVTGTVVAASDNTPVPGVSVTIKGTTRGTVTDSDGRFSLMANASDVLVFSFIGMATQEILVGSQQNMQVTLSS